jgi:predicted HD phosphohydrolase
VQTATRAQDEGASAELVVIALLHDAYRPVSDVYHGEVAAYALREWVSDRGFQILYTHSKFQDSAYRGDPAPVEPYVFAPWYWDATRLGIWDATSFDPAYPNHDLEMFTPELADVFRLPEDDVLELLAT